MEVLVLGGRPFDARRRLVVVICISLLSRARTTAHHAFLPELWRGSPHKRGEVHKVRHAESRLCTIIRPVLPRCRRRH